QVARLKQAKLAEDIAEVRGRALADVVRGDDGNADGQVALRVREARGRDDHRIVLGEAKRREYAGEESGGKTEHMNLPGVFPDACKWLKRLPGRSPDSRGMPFRPSGESAPWPCIETALSLTVAGAVEASHLIPEHLVARG